MNKENSINSSKVKKKKEMGKRNNQKGVENRKDKVAEINSISQ